MLSLGRLRGVMAVRREGGLWVFERQTGGPVWGAG